jgi:diacylglycerol O-acyltransferase-1
MSTAESSSQPVLAMRHIRSTPSDVAMLGEEFLAAAQQVWKHRYSEAFQSSKMRLYGLYKASTSGKCNLPKPRLIMGQELARSKWESWMQASTLSKDEAMRTYIEVADEVVKQCLGDSGDEALHEVKRLNERTKKLESYLQRIEAEMSQMDALGNDMSGYLFRWTDRAASLWGGQKWERCFFTLKDTSLAVYKSDQEPRPEAHISLHNCVLQDEGTKEGRRNRRSGRSKEEYHIFGLYLAYEGSRGPDAGVILRLSSDNEAEAQRWMEALGKATILDEAVPESPREVDSPAMPAPLARQKSRNAILVPPIAAPPRKQFNPAAYPASRPMHVDTKPSILSSESPQQDYRGFFNLAAILFAVNHVRFIWANLLQYGVRLTVPEIRPDMYRDWPCLSGTLLLSLHVLVAYATERWARPGRPGGPSERTLILIHGSNIAVEVCVPLWIVWNYDGSPIFGFFYLWTAIVLMMKLVSYAHYNRDVRLAWKDLAAQKKKGNGNGISAGGAHAHAEGGGSRYPENITLPNIIYFWFAPTLSYQIEYPRSDRVRKREVIWLCWQLVLHSALLMVVVEQYFYPAVVASYEPISRGDWLKTVETLLHLCVPSTYLWLLGFWLFFHVLLNLIAEVLRFGDRVFYRDWWNSNSVEVFWALWNAPVHYWMVRHIYFPCLRAGFSKSTSRALCFLLSAVFHELLISVPFRMIKFYAFLGMIANVPLAVLTKKMLVWFGKDSQVGNFVFWLTFCIVGQPTSACLYYFDFVRQHSSGAAGA